MAFSSVNKHCLCSCAWLDHLRFREYGYPCEIYAYSPAEPPPLKRSAPIVRKVWAQRWPLRDPSPKRLSWSYGWLPNSTRTLVTKNIRKTLNSINKIWLMEKSVVLHQENNIKCQYGTKTPIYHAVTYNRTHGNALTHSCNTKIKQ